MKLLHAAALALVGWYLIYPPLDVPMTLASLATTSKASLSRWVRAPGDEFRSEDDCRAQLANDQTSAETAARLSAHDNPGPGANIATYLAERSKFGQCVSYDDPRLKEP